MKARSIARFAAPLLNIQTPQPPQPRQVSISGMRSLDHQKSGDNTPNTRMDEKEPDTVPVAVEDDNDGRAHVDQYPNPKDFPFETGEVVWLFKTGYRALLGPFRITEAHPNDKFRIVKISDNTTYPEIVYGSDLRRDP
ncbi:hypothetical protein QBC41DRAFT_331325 [Cercophora samala]|uniref:Uncharacterized protein n=1 Tax=Cercophora samala TaxID=330535 RepID=A0AA39YWX4_9PEZI|nr:hypothetical protein QBC41DRAFT_331325 [Cercophora samala]